MPENEQTKLDVGNYGTSNSSEDVPEWKWRSVALAVIGQWCCFLCGVPAVVASLVSYTDHRAGDYGRYRTRKRLAIKLAIAAIIFGIIVLIIQIWWLTSHSKAVSDLIVRIQNDEKERKKNGHGSDATMTYQPHETTQKATDKATEAPVTDAPPATGGSAQDDTGVTDDTGGTGGF